MRDILVQRRVPPQGVPAPSSLREWALAALGPVSGELTIRIVDEDEGRTLNHRYRGKDYATNVLSFPYDGETLDVPILGDLVLCAPVVGREAVEQGKDPRNHWAHLVVHGCLHLLGYDHQTDREAREMEDRERAILATFAIPDPYR
ncbi:MAG TPA: rRNA maturation RNase YbeY [Nevskiaceae bacterium]|nr:rRNA maturation RNase YbeY [Nevskiaceae bacterium]